MTEKKEKEIVEEMNYECPFDEIRSSEREEITLLFNNNGKPRDGEDQKSGDIYRYFEFDCDFIGSIPKFNKKGIKYTTSSKRLINALTKYQPIKNKKIKIIKTGQGNQTTYSATEVK